MTSGMSGLTYDILRHWPDEAIELAYAAITKIKSAGSQPTHWMWKWMSPIPKVAGDNSLANIRPISLIEVLCKVWSGLRVKKIWHLVEKFGLLHSSQHGYRRKRGTDTLTIQLIDVLEQVRESASALALASWDTIRAFDSISRMLAMLGLLRMGVPVADCEDIINIDEGGSVFVKCPHSTKIWQKRISRCPNGRSYTSLDVSEAPPFTAQRGIGQGNNHSPLTYNCTEDIVLTALDDLGLDPVGTSPLYSRAAENNLRAVEDPCYADDLLSRCGCLKDLQTKADVMSAMAMIFKLKFNMKKLRLFLLEFNMFSNITPDPVLVIRENHWDNQIHCSLSTTGEFKSVGVIHSLSGTSSQLETNLQYVKRVCKVIDSKKAWARSKILALNCHVFNKVAYVGQFGSWSLADYRLFDVPVQELLRRTTHNLPSHASLLLYMPRSSGGLQLKRLSDYMIMAKFGVLHRTLLADANTAAAADALLLRLARSCGLGLTPGPLSLRTGGGNRLWASVLPEWLSELGLTLKRNGETKSYSDTPLSNYLPAELTKTLNNKGVDVVGDLAGSRGGPARWCALADANVVSLLPGIPSGSISIRVGQLWLSRKASSGLSPGEIAEILVLKSISSVVACNRKVPTLSPCHP